MCSNQAVYIFIYIINREKKVSPFNQHMYVYKFEKEKKREKILLLQLEIIRKTNR